MGRFRRDKNEKKEEKDKEKMEDMEERVDSVINQASRLREMDELNPLEQAIKYERVRKNPPKKDFMKVECYNAEDEDGNQYILSASRQLDGSIKIVKDKPFFTVDLKSAIEADIAACPANVGPMILEEGIKLAKLKKDTFKTERRRDENKMMTIIMIVCIIIMMIGGIFGIMMFF